MESTAVALLSNLLPMRHLLLTSSLFFASVPFAGPVAAQLAYEDETLVAPNPEMGDQLGYALAVDGNFLAVSAPRLGYVGTGNPQARIEIFERDPAAGWQPSATIETPVDVPVAHLLSDQFGSVLAIEGERLVANLSRGDSSSVLVFERSTDGIWNETARIRPSAPQVLSLFGESLALSGDRLLVGSEAYQTVPPAGQTTIGSAFLFELDASGAWTQSNKFDSPDPDVNGSFGTQVRMEDSRIAISDKTRETAAGPSQGAIHIFELTPQGQWAETFEISAPVMPEFSWFGFRFDLDGDRLVASSRRAPIAPAVTDFVFELQAGGAWPQVAVRQNDPGTGRNTIDIEGDRIAIGRGFAPSFPQLTTPGEVALFVRGSNGTWREEIVASSSDGLSYTEFSSAVGLTGSELLVGESRSSRAGFRFGAVHVFELSSLYHGIPTVSLGSGGEQELFLRAGDSHANETWLMAGSASGIAPGLQLPGGLVLPLVFDDYTLNLLSGAGLVFPYFGMLDANGHADATIMIPPGLPVTLAGSTVHHAFVTLGTAAPLTPTFVSRPVALTATL